MTTCEYCACAPVECALVADLASSRVTVLVCTRCGLANIDDAKRLSKGGASAWLFRLASVPDDETAATAAGGISDE